MSPARALAGALLAGALLFATGTLRERAFERHQASLQYEDVYYLPPPRWLERFSLGHREALADLVWMRGLVYMGDEWAVEGELRNLLRYADAVLHLDPDFKRAYLWAGNAGMYRINRVTVDQLMEALVYLRRAAERFPGDGEVQWRLGAALAYDVAPEVRRQGDEAAAEALVTEGLVHTQRAARLGAGPPWIALSNATRLEGLGRDEQAAQHLEEMFAVTTDPEVRAQIRLRIARLRGRAHARAIQATVEDVEARRDASFPYLPATLFLLVGDRTEPARDAMLRSRFTAALAGGEAAP
ncbi:MAG: hypothetical protein AAGH15_20810 [Myxococcota bacterium]